MVSSGTVSSDASELKQFGSDYTSKVGELSSSWKGASYDNIVNRASEFTSELQNVANQLSTFSEAVSLYESYKQAKDSYNSTTDEKQKSEYQSRMNNYASQIKSALSSASSYKLTATSLTASIGIEAEADTTDTTDTTTQTQNAVTTEGGQFVADSRKGVYGYIEINGRRFTIFRQSQIEGWARNCNRAAAASIASAYGNANDAVNIAKKASNGLGYNNAVTNKYFNQFGLKANCRNVNTRYDKFKDEIVSNLTQGNYVMFDLSQPNVVGKSGQKWTSTRHWVSVLDIKKTSNGSYAIYVSDSGHGGSATDHGLGKGWYSLDEFNGKKIENFTTISKA